MIFPAFTVQLPKWVNTCIPDSKTIYSSIEERMELAVELAAQNIKHDGGPFGAAVFERQTGNLSLLESTLLCRQTVQWFTLK